MATPTHAIWTPPHSKATAINAFRLYVNRKYDLQLTTYQDIHEWSVSEIPSFSEAVFSFVVITTSVPYERVVDGVEAMYPPPRWFPGAKLNYAENMLRPGVATRPLGIGVTTVDEVSSRGQDYTFRDLERRTAIWANALRKLGVRTGDRVAVILPNRIDCLLLLLASASIGAIFSSTSPDMGVTGIVERFTQIRPVVMLCDTVVRYGGRQLDLQQKFSEAGKALRKTAPELRSMIVINGPTFDGTNVNSAKEVLDDVATAISYEQLPFDHPVYILYSSGTTGAPKCITHAAGRALLMQKKELMLGNDIGPNSTLYQYTTTGWMMWNWSVASLSIGARILLYDGSPLFPNPAEQLNLIQREKVTHWGTSPKFLTSLKQYGLPNNVDLESLQAVASAGSPLSVELHQWFATAFPEKVGLFSGSGGMDLVGGRSPMAHLYAGEIARPNLGMKVEIWSGQAHNIENTGDKGDLVITKPFFSMPVGFWGPKGDAQYRAAYFEQYPGVWYHGDFVRKNPRTGGYEILGRSDGVLNPGGIRFGTAEIYGIMDKISEVQDCLCVGQKLPPTYVDEQVLLFLKMHDGQQVDDKLKVRIKKAISDALSARHVPSQIYQVTDIPYTVNGKRIENLVRDIVGGKPLNQARTVANPECLPEYQRFTLPTAGKPVSKL